MKGRHGPEKRDWEVIHGGSTPYGNHCSLHVSKIERFESDGRMSNAASEHEDGIAAAVCTSEIGLVYFRSPGLLKVIHGSSYLHLKPSSDFTQEIPRGTHVLLYLVAHAAWGETEFKTKRVSKPPFNFWAVEEGWE